MTSKRMMAAAISGSLLAGAALGLILFGPSLATAQTTNAPPAVVNAPSAASGTGATFASNEDPAHEAAESPEREAEENSGKGFGHHGFNEDPAHEAGESPEREAQEDAGNAPSAGAPASNSGSSTLQ